MLGWAELGGLMLGGAELGGVMLGGAELGGWLWGWAELARNHSTVVANPSAYPTAGVQPSRSRASRMSGQRRRGSSVTPDTKSIGDVLPAMSRISSAMRRTVSSSGLPTLTGPAKSLCANAN